MCYTYDDLSRVTSRTVKNISDDSVVSTETFTYDAAGIRFTLLATYCYLITGNSAGFDRVGEILERTS